MATRDIAAYQPGQPKQFYIPALVTSTISGREITGVEKLAQRFLLELMTDTGSMQFLPTRGCNFLTRLRGSLFSEADVMSAFYASVATVRKNLQAEESVIDPDEERFEKAKLVKIVISPGGLALTVVVFSAANQAATIELPVSLTIKAGTTATIV